MEKKSMGGGSGEENEEKRAVLQGGGCAGVQCSSKQRSTEKGKIVAGAEMVGLQDIPDEIIKSISLRLPVKDFIVFKSVSPKWYALLSTPEFALNYFNDETEVTYKLLCIANDLTSVALDVEKDCVYNSRSLQFVRQPDCYNHIPLIAGSCRGFVLVWIKVWPNPILYIWNPTTGYNRRLPFPSLAMRMDGEDPEPVFGFGYNTLDDDYIVLIVWQRFMQPGEYYRSSFEMLSLRSNQWEEITGVENRYKSHCYRRGGMHGAGLLLHNHIHWYCIRSDDHTCRPISVFNMIERTFSEFNLPQAFSEKPQHYFKICLLGGRLGLVVSGYNDDHNDIWIMEEYGVESSWTLIATLPHFPVFHPYQGFHPIWMTKNGDMLGFSWEHKSLTRVAKINTEGQFVEAYPCCEEDFVGCRGYGTIYVESLLSLPGSIPANLPPPSPCHHHQPAAINLHSQSL